MRVGLVVRVFTASCLGIASFASLGSAQTPPAQPAPPPPAQPVAPAAPAQQAPAPAAPPPTAAAPATRPVGEATLSSEGFDITEALRGPGAAMSADEAARRAAETAPSVTKAEAAARQAALAAEQAKIGYYPRLELEARYTYLSKTNTFADIFAQSGTPTDFGPGFEPQEHTGLFEARLNYPVSALFFSIIPNYKAATKRADAQRLQKVVQEQTIAVQTRTTYFNYAGLRAALMVTKAAQGQAEARRRDVEALVNAGSMAKVELMRADAQVAQAKVLVSSAAGRVATARAALFTLLHLEGNDDLSISEDFQTELPALVETQDSLLAKALGNRSELRFLRLNQEALEHQIDAAQGQQLPQLVIGGVADYANPNQRWIGSNFEFKGSWAAYAALQWSPNDWVENGSVADQLRAQLAQTLADLEQLEDNLRVEVNQAYEDYNTARASLEAARAGIAAAEESYRVRREQFRAGAAVAIDVIDAEADLRDVRLELVQAVINTRVARARLDRAVEAPLPGAPKR